MNAIDVIKLIITLGPEGLAFIEALIAAFRALPPAHQDTLSATLADIAKKK